MMFNTADEHRKSSTLPSRTFASSRPFKFAYMAKATKCAFVLYGQQQSNAYVLTSITSLPCKIGRTTLVFSATVTAHSTLNVTRRLAAEVSGVGESARGFSGN